MDLSYGNLDGMERDIKNWSRASKKRWKDVPKEERARRMRAVALKRWENASKKERREQYEKMQPLSKNKKTV